MVVLAVISVLTRIWKEMLVYWVVILLTVFPSKVGQCELSAWFSIVDPARIEKLFWNLMEHECIEHIMCVVWFFVSLLVCLFCFVFSYPPKFNFMYILHAWDSSDWQHWMYTCNRHIAFCVILDTFLAICASEREATFTSCIECMSVIYGRIWSSCIYGISYARPLL